MNGNAAAVNGGGAAADARAGITAIVSHAGGVQRAAIFGLGVDGQAVGARHHNALCRSQGAAVRQDQVHIAADGDGFGNGDGVVDYIPAAVCPFRCAVCHGGAAIGGFGCICNPVIPGRFLIRR